MPTSKSTLPRDDAVPESLIAFQERSRSERACAKFLHRWKYGDAGFLRPHCGSTKSRHLAARRLDECRGCGKQTSLTAGTLLHKSRKPLRLWFMAIYLFVRSKQGISAMGLMRKWGVSYPTAWTWLHKLRGVVACREASLLGGIVEVDETLEGGRDKGHQGGRGTAKKTVVAGAVAWRSRATTPGSVAAACR